MRITPLEIRQHTFDKSFRGYDTESVDAFLLSLSQEWERVAEEVRVTKQLLDKAEQEDTRVKEIESSLFKTIKVAEEAQKLVGQSGLTDDQIKQKTKSEIVRKVAPGQPMTMDYRTNRVTVTIDPATKKITQATCG